MSAADQPAQTSTVRGTLDALVQTLKRWQFWLLLLVFGAIVTLAVQLISTEDTERYGLENTALDGYAALARTLEDQGVELHRTYSGAEAAAQLEETPEAAVVVLHSSLHQPSDDTVEELTEHAQGHPVIWISPDAMLLAQLGDEQAQVLPISEDPQATSSQTMLLEAGEDCAIEAAQSAESLETTGEVFRTDLSRGGSCFPLSPQHPDAGSALVETEQGILFGAPDAFTNREIVTQGHAALALQMLGQREDLVWYTPSGADAAGDGQWASPTELLPDWAIPLTVWLLICGLLLMLVQGRRHGPVIVEPLPVEVPASEAAEGRARMYQNADAVHASARALRAAALLRLARTLRLGPSPAEAVITEAAARHTGRSVHETRQLFDITHIRRNTDLVRFGQQLADFEDDLLKRLGHAPRERN
ncbi:DUF4350 domain-containing protein [Nesterenkonia lacusekhoensis]|uniref:DUF4350 domain-containing protein n=1 Tax=Nesterenkonia lacusekhoensis TaxID=150832 RepID=A0ABS4T2H5_9MICC|nr:DUF4350 domain-containing protein [Nesterenkonia lacusekhoensis]MBP2318644.1 hypothetical protein [Nesterenkonia lacusekhoensis]